MNQIYAVFFILGGLVGIGAYYSFAKASLKVVKDKADKVWKEQETEIERLRAQVALWVNKV